MEEKEGVQAKPENWKIVAIHGCDYDGWNPMTHIVRLNLADENAVKSFLENSVLIDIKGVKYWDMDKSDILFDFLHENPNICDIVNEEDCLEYRIHYTFLPDVVNTWTNTNVDESFWKDEEDDEYDEEDDEEDDEAVEE